MSPDPSCTVQDGAGAPTATTNGVNVTPANVITVALASTAGVGVWTLSVYGRDELVSPPAITINSTNKTATFTAPAAGSALILKSVVGASSLGYDINGVVQPSYTTTLGVYTLINGLRVGAINETTEGNSTAGWVSKVNTLIRTPPSGSTPTGSGVRHVTAGVEDGTANKGTANQVSVTNAGATDTAWASTGGDISGAIGAMVVGALSSAAATLNIPTSALTFQSSACAVATDLRSKWTAGTETKWAYRAAGVDYKVASVGNAAITFGDSAAQCILDAGTSRLDLQPSNYFRCNVATGQSFQICDYASTTIQWKFDVVKAGASKLTTAIDATSITYMQADQTAASTSGVATNVNAQNATGSGASDGGTLALRGGTSTNGAYGLTQIQSACDLGLLNYTFASDANQTLTAAQSANNVLNIVAGVISVGRTITLTRRVANPGLIFVRNNNAQTVTIQWLTGTGVTLTTGTSALIGSDGANALVLMRGT